MAQTVNLATARELSEAGAVRHVTVLGQTGGYAILLRVGMKDQLLATKLGRPRLFSHIATAVDLLRDEFGISKFDVDTTNYARGDITRKPRVSAVRSREREAIQHDRWFRGRVSDTLAKQDKGYQPLATAFDHLEKRAAALQGKDA